jgi:predicted nucleic acid-binding protein
MKVLLDTNVVLDVLLSREPWVKSASAIWRAVDENRITGCIAACTLTNIDYIAQRIKDRATAQLALQLCLKTFEICPVDYQTVDTALELPGSDFEDNVQIACALRAGIETIITRDSTGFQAAEMSILSPDEFVETYLL